MTVNSSKIGQVDRVVCRTDRESCDDLDLKLSKSWLRIAIAAVFAGQGMVFSLALNMTPPPFGSIPYWVLHGGLIFSTLIVLVFLGGPLFTSTFGMLRNRQISIEGLFTLSLLGAFGGSLFGSFTGEGNVYYEIVAIVIAIYTFGRMLSVRSQEKVLLEADRLREGLDTAVRIGSDGTLERIEVSSLKHGDRVRVEPGEAFTVDGRILDGVGYLSETALSGEPGPVIRRAGDRVRAGTHSVDGSFVVMVESVRGEREIDQILETVEDPDGAPSELQEQANRLSQFFLPSVAFVSLATGVGWFWAEGWHSAFLNSMAVLLVACPCALGLATPAAIWHGLYRLSSKGLVSRDGALIDVLAQAKRVFFDKTGTLSEDELRVVSCEFTDTWEHRKRDLLRAAYGIETHVGHPVARGIANFCMEQGVEPSVVGQRSIVPGNGVEAEVSIAGETLELHLGSFEFGDAENRKVDSLLKDCDAGKHVCLYCNQKLAAVFMLRERLRDSVEHVLHELTRRGVAVEVLTGDPAPDGSLEVPSSVPMHYGLSAEEKMRRVADSFAKGERPIFVGDGVNDTAAMSQAAASISLESGAALARSRASAEILNARFEVLSDAIDLARAIRRKLRGNLVYAAAYNVVGMALAAAGLLHPVAAALIMLVSSFLVTARALKS